MPFPSGIDAATLRHIGQRLTTLPEGFQPNEKLDKRFLGPRRDAVANGRPLQLGVRGIPRLRLPPP